ncbi:hypothetical protein [Leifsonia sp. 71-9]|uniref:hypothetical protein n=1 Tax=Leifsonia sp. 71-9 TaxID=1895934 RepID=UPI0009274ADF|nr:hypothetical protein [Leifsonia sp. 71-9]OJX72842.1 MAG: hypothetical protein BGO91_13820 [Leifsonia sp. 71-9]
MADDPRPFGLVHGRIYVSVGDTVDAGRAPDQVGTNGTAIFSANVERVITTTVGAEQISLPQKITAQVVNGALQWLGTDDVPLTANLDSAGNSLGWQWRVDWALTYTDPTTNSPQRVTLTGWAFDVKVYNAAAPLVAGVNPTLTQITTQAPVNVASSALLAKGDPGSPMELTIGTVSTTTDPAAAAVTITPTSDPLKKALNFVIPVGAGGGGGGGTGTVSKVNGVSPDGSGALVLSPANIGAAAAVDVQTAQATASNALQAASSAQSAANAAQTTANAAQSGLASKADAGSILGLAPINSPTFAGDPKAPTPATTDNDTSLATTAFVRAAITQYAPTASSSSSVVDLAWDPTTQAWVSGTGAVVTSRPNAKIVRLNGTTDAGATRPGWMATGDQIIPHPDSPLAG